MERILSLNDSSTSSTLASGRDAVCVCEVGGMKQKQCVCVHLLHSTYIQHLRYRFHKQYDTDDTECYN